MNKTLTALYDSFVCGFRLAWRLANELNSYPENGRPTLQKARSSVITC